MGFVVATEVAFVRTESGTVSLAQGDTVPGDADQGHVERLLAAGVLTDPPSTSPDTGTGGAEGSTSRRGGKQPPRDPK